MDENGNLDIPVKWGGLSVGKKTARLGFVVARGKADNDVLNAHFVDSRLEVTMILDALSESDEPGQKSFTDPEAEVNTVADAKGYRTNMGEYSSALTFARDDVDLEALLDFAERGGRLKAERIGNASPQKDPPKE